MRKALEAIAVGYFGRSQWVSLRYPSVTDWEIAKAALGTLAPGRWQSCPNFSTYDGVTPPGECFVHETDASQPERHRRWAYSCPECVAKWFAANGACDPAGGT